MRSPLLSLFLYLLFPLVANAAYEPLPAGTPAAPDYNFRSIDEDFRILKSSINTSFFYANPIGSIVAIATSAAPTGWLECDGSSLLRAGTYANLFAVIGTAYGTADATHFNIPDLRGWFLRGWAHGQSTDPNAAERTAATTGGITGDAVGSVQLSTFTAHTHIAKREAAGARAATAGGGATHDNGDSLTSETGYSETRPRNVNIMYIIKY